LKSFPSKQQLTRLLGDDDYFVWEYHGKGLGWIFRSRVKVITRFFRQLQPKPRMILDVGCGPMFISTSLASNHLGEYVGIDVLPTERLKKYKDVMKKLGLQEVETIRASAESLPLKECAFDFVLSLDVLEHLAKSKRAILEIKRVTKNGCTVAISLPLENSIQRFSRIGFKLLKPKPFENNATDSGKESIKVPITKTPDYHYVGDVDSYDSMSTQLKSNFKLQCTKYAPLGFISAININAVHFLKK
jgi:SAM-dependent methyltransferase